MQFSIILEEVEKLNTKEQFLLIDILKKRLLNIDYNNNEINSKDLNKIYEEISNNDFNKLSDSTFNQWDNEIDKVYDEL